MANLSFMQGCELDPKSVRCPHCQGDERIGVHSHPKRLYICHGCSKTFGESKGTVFENLHYSWWVVVLVLTLLAYGCPVSAIVAAFKIDERTVLDWQAKAGQQGKVLQEQVVCNGNIELGQVQADELRVKMQGQIVWMATTMTVFSRLFIWGCHRYVSKRLSSGLFRSGIVPCFQ